MRPREHVSSVVVSALSSFFGVVLIQATGLLTDLLGGGSGEVQTALVTVAAVFIALAMYTSAIVTANTFGTIVAGRTQSIALMRLVGASARQLRRSIGREGILVGLIGALAGAVIAILVTQVVVHWQLVEGNIPDVAYRIVEPLVVLPMAGVLLTTWGASLVGSRRVLDVSPIQATTAAQEPSAEEARRRPVRNAFALLLIIAGAAMLGIGIVIGLFSPFGLFVAFLGGIGSFTGIVLGAHVVMPFVLQLVGRLFGRGAPARLAAVNAMRYPDRSTRNTIGLVIGVTLVVTFSVAAASYQAMFESAIGLSQEEIAQASQAIAVTFAVLAALIGFSAIIAAVGMINNLSLGVLQRTRELGLLRALGFTGGQVRGMIVVESAQMVLAAIGLGLLLGVLYGWAAAQSLLASLLDTGLVLPTLPLPILGGVVLGGAALAIVASIAPARRATTISPVRALQED